jgi:hypothetical protein
MERVHVLLDVDPLAGFEGDQEVIVVGVGLAIGVLAVG